MKKYAFDINDYEIQSRGITKLDKINGSITHKVFEARAQLNIVKYNMF